MAKPMIQVGKLTRGTTAVAAAVFQRGIATVSSPIDHHWLIQYGGFEKPLILKLIIPGNGIPAVFYIHFLLSHAEWFIGRRKQRFADAPTPAPPIRRSVDAVRK